MEKLLTTREVAEILGIKHRTLYRWMQTGIFDITPVRISPKAVRFRESDVKAWIESRVKGAVINA